MEFGEDLFKISKDLKQKKFENVADVEQNRCLVTKRKEFHDETMESEVEEYEE